MTQEKFFSESNLICNKKLQIFPISAVKKYEIPDFFLNLFKLKFNKKSAIGIFFHSCET